MEKAEEELKMEKPKFLYHGSPHVDIEEFEPRISPGGEKYGALVYASPDLAAASIFMLKTDRSWSASRFSFTGRYDVLCAIITEPREDFIKHDVGGHIYVLPSDTFETDPNRGLKEKEWASKVKVKPVQKLEFKSALDAVIENGVQVYFVDSEIYEKMESSKDHGQEILKNLESENQKRGVNIKKLE